MKRRTCLQAGLAATLPLPIASFAASTVPSGAARRPLEDFAERPLMEYVRISPNGKMFAAVVNSGSKSMLVTRAAAGGPPQTVMQTDNLEFQFRWFEWLNNERLVLSLRFPSYRQTGYVSRIPTMETRLFAANADGSNLINLVRERKVGNDLQLRWAATQDNVIDWLSEDGRHILLTLPASEREIEPAVYKIDCYTGERSHYRGTRKDIYRWMTDRQHRVRIGVEYGKDSSTSIWVCDPDEKNWRVLHKNLPFASDSVWPAGFGPDPQLLYVYAKEKGFGVVKLLDLSRPDAPAELVFSLPDRDADFWLIRDEKGLPIGVNSGAFGDPNTRFWSPRHREWLGDIDEALPQRLNSIADIAADGRTLVVHSAPSSRPASYFMITMDESPELRLIAKTSPKLDGVKLERKEPIEFNARDGLLIRGYLTLPPAQNSGKNLPMVLLPHSNPRSEDGPWFDRAVAFMADRGWAVLQVNFRGSTGRGHAFMEAGLRRWGLEMQDDLTDAVQEFIKRGIADPARVAVVGSNYGGYAALMGVVKTPALFCGAFAIAPVTDLLELSAEEGQYSNREWYRRQIGDARDDREQLEETSPRRRADAIKVPVVLIHGTHDRVVPHDQSVWMAEALKKAGHQNHKFISLEKGDHELSHQPYRLQLFAELEAFLDRVLAPKPA